MRNSVRHFPLALLQQWKSISNPSPTGVSAESYELKTHKAPYENSIPQSLKRKVESKNTHIFSEVHTKKKWSQMLE